MFITYDTILSIKFQHLVIEFVEVVVAQISSISQIPSPSTVVIVPIITLSRKINPLWMSKFISHEVQIPKSTQTESQQSYHLMQSYPSKHPCSLLTKYTHIVVYIFIE